MAAWKALSEMSPCVAPYIVGLFWGSFKGIYKGFSWVSKRVVYG